MSLTVSGIVLIPQGIDAVLQPGCAMQLQSVGVGKVAVTGSGTSITNHTTNSTAECLIKSTKDGVTKLMQLKGAGSVTIKEDPLGILKISGDIAEVQNAHTAAVSFLTSGSVDAETTCKCQTP